MFCIVVGTVSETRFKMGPVGNYNPEFNKLKDAKYTFGLDEPTNPDFRPDWATAVKALETAENMIQGTNDHRHFIEKIGNLRSLRLSARVLQEKVWFNYNDQLNDLTTNHRIPEYQVNAFAIIDTYIDIFS